MRPARLIQSLVFAGLDPAIQSLDQSVKDWIPRSSRGMTWVGVGATWYETSFPPRPLRHRHLGQLEGDVAAMVDHLGADLHQLLPQRGQRPVLDGLVRRQLPVQPGPFASTTRFKSIGL